MVDCVYDATYAPGLAHPVVTVSTASVMNLMCWTIDKLLIEPERPIGLN